MPRPLQELAVQEAEAGMDWIDLNIGPAGKTGVDLMSWLVPVVHEVVDLPLALDTSNIKAIEAGLKAHKKGRPLINSIMVRPERMDALLPLAAQYDADFVGLLWGPEGMPRDENERGALCAELVFKAEGEFGIAPERMLIDPIQTPVNVQQGQIMSVSGVHEDVRRTSLPGAAAPSGSPMFPTDHPITCGPFSTRSCSSSGSATASIRPSSILSIPRLHDIARGKHPDLEALVHKGGGR